MVKEIEKLSVREEAPLSDGGALHVMERKINELIEAYNNHVHYARELQFRTSTPDNPEVYK